MSDDLVMEWLGEPAPETLEGLRARIEALEAALLSCNAERARFQVALIKLRDQTDVTDKAYRDNLRRPHLLRMLAVAHDIARAALNTPDREGDK